MAEPGDFELVEFAARDMPKFRNRIVRVDEVPELVKQHGPGNCYTTCFLFDQGLADHVKSTGGSVGGYRGPCYAEVLYVDIDAGELERAQATARDLCSFLVGHWGASAEAISPFFSGRRGFHLGIHCGVFGDVQPGERLPDVLHRVLRSVVAQARPRYRASVDYSVGKRLSLIRLPNTEHLESGLYKVPLSVSELMGCTADQIRRLARSEREIEFTDPTGLLALYEVAMVPPAAELYDRSVGELRQRSNGDLPPAESFLEGGNLADVLCDAELELYRQGVPNGARSRTALRLASRMRCAGYGEKAVVDRLLDWNERNEPPMEGPEVERIGRCAFSVGVPYQWGCGTGGEGDPPDAKLIYEACPYRNRWECGMYRAFQAQRHPASGRE